MKETNTRIYDDIFFSFFKEKGWQPLSFQIEAWNSFLNGDSGIIQVPTGCGKTYAALLGPLKKLKDLKNPKGVNILFITPLKALSRDIEKSIKEAAKYFDKKITISVRNGDTSSYEKRKQLKNPPNILITTPESLSLLIAQRESDIFFDNLISIIIDEWHELLISKRGNQCELALSWLRRNREIQVFAMSATIGNIKEAARAIVGIKAKEPTIIKSNLIKKIHIKSVIPENIGSFPWNGHLGIRSHQSLLNMIDKNKSTLFFTNTRNQSERWFQCLKYYNSEIENKIAIHHGSLDKDERQLVEEGVKNGSIKWVICTSSLDLGVDFQQVDQIVQIGSAKNLARLIQRAGRSAHKPGGNSKIIFMPTNALELLEVSAMRRLIKEEISENIHLPELSFDVLLQHLVSLACGPGFNPKEEKKNIKDCWSYRNLKDEEWNWCLDFLEYGGKCLKAYPKYQKIHKKFSDKKEKSYKYFVKDHSIIRIHKFNIGTITSNNYLNVKFINGKTLGNLEENFSSKLKSGDVFFFAGKMLEFIKVKDMNVYVKKSIKKSAMIPAWIGGQIAISDLLSRNIRKEIDICGKLNKSNKNISEEINALKPILKRQKIISDIPKINELLIEIYKTKKYRSLFVFTLEGKFANEGIGFLWALRFAKRLKTTFIISANDFGFSLTTYEDFDFPSILKEPSSLLDSKNLNEDLENAINLSELTKRKFKNIAQVSGLINNNTPFNSKNSSQLNISSSLLFDVFTKYEKEHLLIKQAQKEVIKDTLESERIKKSLIRISNLRLIINETKEPSPFAFPLLVERLSSTFSNESIETRIERLINSYGK
tara:strand:- start:4160 stop:6634 length:2475 start_codon:yes stop_codon:yes gene_type:complete